MKLLVSLGMPYPQSYTVTSVDQAIAIISSHPVSRPLILKASVALDDIGRTDWTFYPIQGDHSCTLTRKKLNNLPIPISEHEPFLLQEFIRGAEYCTHALVVENQLRAFVCCPSSNMVMRYLAAEENISKKAEEWTTDFLAAYSKERPEAPFTGHLSMDFIHRKEDDSLYPIECNPRVHTAVSLLAQDTALVDAYLSVLPSCDQERSDYQQPMVHTQPDTSPLSWHGHMWFTVFLPYLFPILTRIGLHPTFDYIVTDEEAKSQLPYTDATWDPDDPWPFFALYHVQWPWYLARFLVMRRHKRWNRFNVSTGTMFEC
ncbi:hypothetical protein DACRYDRAFT_108508 [Dacryopinax primogenitus]|uniref:ATP-grasp domain-containing protein n=1 Tax=Dacryopinax primogenitus (strain DJM 731) TaxID=1858805 RepID=M5FU21_DACPD|nr:uncharacterized protein DACRYDRAFT_108508 [Dacryopinax primogenitus]EJU01176.1 hypothetical protein DACRYDRAFT_108508 [Dacryopinax primogenitus]